jgi:glycerol kinase
MGAPHWDGRARGAIVGMTRGTRREHIVRATLESIAYQTRDVAEAMEADTGLEITSLEVDGGAVKNNFLCQQQADIIGAQIVRPDVDETTALGSAYAAGLAVGYWSDLEELRENWQVDRTFEPDEASDTEDNYEQWLRAVERSLSWAQEDS